MSQTVHALQKVTHNIAQEGPRSGECSTVVKKPGSLNKPGLRSTQWGLLNYGMGQTHWAIVAPRAIIGWLAIILPTIPYSSTHNRLSQECADIQKRPHLRIVKDDQIYTQWTSACNCRPIRPKLAPSLFKVIVFELNSVIAVPTINFYFILHGNAPLWVCQTICPNYNSLVELV